MTLLALVLLAQTAAAGPQTLSLEEALAQAARQDPSTAVFEAQISAEEARAAFVGRRFLRAPEVGVSADRALEAGRYVDSTVEVGVSDEWNLSSGPGRLRDAAERRARAARQDMSSRTAERSSQVLEVVLRSRDLERRFRLEDELAASFEEIAKAVGRRVGEGLAGATDATFARGEAANWRSAAQATRAELDSTHVELAALVGSEVSVTVTGDPARGALGPDDTRLLARLGDRPDLKSFDERIAAARADVEAQRSGRIPALRVGVSAAQETSAARGEDFDFGPGAAGTVRGFRTTDTIVGVQVGVPFPFRRGVRADVLAATAELRSLEAQRTVRLRELRAEAQSALAARRAADERVKTLEPLQAELPGARDRLSQAYREGRLDLERFLNQRERLYEVENAYLEALRDRDAADVRLSFTLGGPWGLSLLPPEGAP